MALLTLYGFLHHCTIVGCYITRGCWIAIVHLHVLYTMSQKNAQPVACYYFDTHERILTCFRRNGADKVRNQKVLYYTTSNNLCFCITWQNGKCKNCIFHLLCKCIAGIQL